MQSYRELEHAWQLVLTNCKRASEPPQCVAANAAFIQAFNREASKILHGGDA